MGTAGLSGLFLSPLPPHAAAAAFGEGGANATQLHTWNQHSLCIGCVCCVCVLVCVVLGVCVGACECCACECCECMCVSVVHMTVVWVCECVCARGCVRVCECMCVVCVCAHLHTHMHMCVCALFLMRDSASRMGAWTDWVSNTAINKYNHTWSLTWNCRACSLLRSTHTRTLPSVELVAIKPSGAMDRPVTWKRNTASFTLTSSTVQYLFFSQVSFHTHTKHSGLFLHLTHTHTHTKLWFLGEKMFQRLFILLHFLYFPARKCKIFHWEVCMSQCISNKVCHCRTGSLYCIFSQRILLCRKQGRMC